MNQNNIYSILSKMAELEKKSETKPAVIKEDSMLKGLSSETSAVANRLNERYLAEKDMGKHNNGTTGFKALAKKAGGGEKGAKIAGAQFQKMKKAGQLEEDDVEEGNDFTGARLAAVKAGKPTFSVGGKTYKVTGDTSDEKMMENFDYNASITGKAAENHEEEKEQDDIQTQSPIDSEEEHDEVDESATGSIEINGKTVDNSSLELDGVDSKDHPDYADAYFSHGTFEDGTPLSDQELDQLTDEHGDLVNQMAHDSLHEDAQEPDTESMQECDPHSAYAPLPGMRPTSPDEHSEYRHAAQTLRKWMRKRGHNPHKDFVKSLSYIGDNLDEDHDDTLTPDVFDAYHTVQKHRQIHKIGMVDEGQTIQTKTGLIHKGTYGSDYEEEGGEDDFDEHGNKKVKAAGRPKKEKAPERVTSKAWKHKDGRKVSEGTDISNIVEDTISELQAMFEGKKVDSFVGKVKASEKKVGHSDKEAESIAWATANKRGMLDNKNKKLDESASVRNHPIYTDQSAWDHYKKEMDEEAMANAAAEDPLSDLARLAGVNTTPITHVHEAGCNMTAEGQMCPVHGMTECYGMMESENMSRAAKGHEKYGKEGMKALADAGRDGASKEELDKIRDKYDRYDDEEVNEDMGGTTLEDLLALASGSHGLPPAMGSREVTVLEPDTHGSSMSDLLSKLSGFDGDAEHDHEHEHDHEEGEPCPTCGASPCGCDSEEADHLMGEEFANEPHEEYGTVQAQLDQGNDLNKRKTMYKHNYKGGDNPMGNSDNFMENDDYARLTALYSQFKQIK